MYIVICSWCNHTKGFGFNIKLFLRNPLELSKSHGICPICAEKVKLEIKEEKEKKEFEETMKQLFPEGTK